MDYVVPGHCTGWKAVKLWQLTPVTPDSRLPISGRHHPVLPGPTPTVLSMNLLIETFPDVYAESNTGTRPRFAARGLTASVKSEAAMSLTHGSSSQPDS